MIEPIDWEARLRVAVEKTLADKAARKTEREEFKRRRDYGLARRHAAKQARNRQEADVPYPPPCCAETPESLCEQHKQAHRELRFQGPKRASRGATAVVGESGRACPAREDEGR